MKEFETPLTKVLLTGLRRDSRGQRNSLGLVQAKDVRAISDVLEYPGAFPRLFTATALDWPFPTIMLASHGLTSVFVGMTTGLYQAPLSGGLVSKVTTTAASHWELLDFHKYMLFNNGQTVYARDPNTGAITAVSSTVIPAGFSMINFRGQIVMGNTVEGRNWLKWGNIGEAEFTIDGRSTAGKMPLPFSGTIKRLLYLNSGVDMSGRDKGSIVVYADTGIAITKAYSDPIATLGFKMVNTQYGIPNWGCVGGHDDEHLFIDSRGDLHRLTVKGDELLGYKEFLAPLIPYDPRIIYDAYDSQYYIMTENTGYVFGKQGLCELNQTFSAGCNSNGIFSVTGDAPSAGVVELTTDVFDMEIRARKQITTLNFGVETDGLVSAAIQTRYDYKSAYITSPWVPLNNKGVCFPRVSGTDFKIMLKATGFTFFQLDRASMRWKLEDKTGIRGTYGNTKATAGAD